jgi:hypothetical protein
MSVRATTRLGVVMVAALAVASCETVDPGPPFVVMPNTFDPNYFYCVVEPQIIMGGLTGVPCGNDGSGGCHYSDKVPAFQLNQLPSPVTCSGSGITATPTNPNQTATGSAANLNLSSCEIEMSSEYMEAPLYLWPTQTVSAHPRMVYSPTDTAVTNILQTWAMQ